MRSVSRVLLAALAAVALPMVARAWVVAIVELPGMREGPDEGCVGAVEGSRATGRAIAALDPEACVAQLVDEGVVFEPAAEADGVTTPVRVLGPIGGVELGGASSAVLDCRLAVALARWAPELRAAGIRRLRAISIHRPGARVRRSGRLSGHAHALALDLGGVVFDEGTELSILEGWESREPGLDPCGEHAEGAEATRLRAAVCAAVRTELFQVVLTPHHDRSHQNHLHLELVPGVPWSYLR